MKQTRLVPEQWQLGMNQVPAEASLSQLAIRPKPPQLTQLQLVKILKPVPKTQPLSVPRL